MGNVLTFNGTWSSMITYDIDDVVFFNGSSYVSLVASNLNHEPDISSAQWSVFAAQGPTGATGSQGPTGPTGPAGAINIFSTTTPPGTLTLPTGKYFIKAVAVIHISAPAALSSDQVATVSCNLTSVGGVTVTGVIPVGSTSVDLEAEIQGVVDFTASTTVIVSVGASGGSFTATVTAIQLQALSVDNITQQ